MNNQVTVTGMTVQTRVNNNLLVSPDATEAHYTLAYNQPLAKTLLEPVSTVNGVNYYYTSTTNVDAIGNAINEAYTAYVAGDDFDKNYGVDKTASTADALGYLDYSFYIKATNADADARKVYFTKCNLLYDGSALNTVAPNIDRAWRAAIFVKKTTAGTTVSDEVAAANVVTILTPSGATNFDTTPKAIGSTGLEALSYGESVAAYNQPAVIDASLTAHATQYYKITVRLWLEGEDTTCTNDTYADLTRDWTLDLEIKLGKGDGSDAFGTPVVLIGSVANAVTTNATTGTVTLTGDALSNGEVAASFAWKKLDGTAATGTGANTATFSAPTEAVAGSYEYYCEITTVKGNVYRTNSVTLNATTGT